MRPLVTLSVSVAVAAAVCFLQAVPAASAAGTTAGLVRGTVIARNGAPIAGARVVLRGGGINEGATTNNAGSFEFSEVAPGTYYIVCSATLFQPVVSAPFSIAEAQVLTLSIVLQPANTSAITSLGTVTIAGRRSTSVPAAPVVTVSNDSMVQAGNLRVTDALDNLPGVSIDYGAGGAVPGLPEFLTIRGAGAYDSGYENVVLQDGEPIRSGWYATDLEDLAPALYSDVELVKGVGASSAYGADSIGGTLNLVTRDPTKTEGGQALLTFGTWGTSDFNIVESNTFNRFGYLLDYHASTGDGNNPRSLADFIPSAWEFGAPPPPPQYSNAVGDLAIPSETSVLHSFFGKFRYDLSHTTYMVATYEQTPSFHDIDAANIFTGGLIYNGVRYQTDPLGYVYVFGTPGSFSETRTTKYAFDFHTQLAGGYLTLKLYQHYIPQTLDIADVPANDCCELEQSSDRLAGEIVSFTKSIGRHVLTVSGSGDAHTFYQAYFDGGPTYGAFPPIPTILSAELEHEYLIRDEYQPSGKFDVTLAAYHSTIDALAVHRTDPKLDIVYRPNTADAVHAYIGTGFAAPPIYDRTSPILLSFANPIPQCPTSEPACAASGGNPELTEERAVGFDVGFQHSVNGASQFGLDLYRTNLFGHIYQGVIPAPAGLTFAPGSNAPGQPVLFLQTYTNLVRTVYQGVEVSGRIAVLHDLAMNASYATQSAFPQGVSVFQQNLDQYVVNNQQLIGTPLHKEYASLNYGNASGTSAYVSWNYYDKNNSFNRPPFSIYNAGATLAVNAEDKLHINWSNIFDGNYYSPPYPGYTYPIVFPPFFYATVNGVSYPGYSGPYPVTVGPSAPHSITVTYEHRWGSLLAR